jgi:hypothetical protein
MQTTRTKMKRNTRPTPRLVYVLEVSIYILYNYIYHTDIVYS